MNTLQQTENAFFLVSIEELKTLFKGIVADFLNERQKEQEQNELVPISEAMQMLNVTRPTLWKWNKKGYLKCCKIGKQVFYKRTDINDLISEKEVITI